MIELIPAIDIMNGRCVRLSQGDYSCRKVYDENPLEVAKAFQDNGLNRLHLVGFGRCESRSCRKL